MHERLFAAPEEWDTTPSAARTSFERYAGELDLDATSFGQCLDAGRYRDEVQVDYNEAVELGMNGTPSFVINGKLLVGAQPTKDWIQILDRELAGR
jgi:protein-disulfide isomerase